MRRTRSAPHTSEIHILGSSEAASGAGVGAALADALGGGARRTAATEKAGPLTQAAESGRRGSARRRDMGA